MNRSMNMLRRGTNCFRMVENGMKLVVSDPSSSNNNGIRYLSSGKSKALGKRIRYGGGIPGPKYVGKISTEMTNRAESILESIRTPKTVVDPIKQWRIVRGDYVQVIANGPDKRKRGRVIEVIRQSNSVVVEGVKIVTKYVPQIGTDRKKPVKTEAPIHVSNVSVVCPQTNLPTRIRYAFLEDGTKVRVSVKSGAIIPRPEILKQRRKKRSQEQSDLAKDTPSDVVLERTYKDDLGLYNSLDGFESVIKVATNSDSS